MRSLPKVISFLALLTGGALQSVAGQEGAIVSAVEYEGWRQYNVHCARCHGQDALPNPVTADLLVSLAPGGPAAERAAFTKIVVEGRPERGMPSFAKLATPEQIHAIHAYLKGRAEKRIPAGRPKNPAPQQKEAPPG